MSRSMVTLLVILLIVVGGMFLLSRRAKEQPVTHVEKVVPLANLAN
jgi:preprotein translocase subunit YajC